MRESEKVLILESFPGRSEEGKESLLNIDPILRLRKTILAKKRAKSNEEKDEDSDSVAD